QVGLVSPIEVHNDEDPGCMEDGRSGRWAVRAFAAAAAYSGSTRQGDVVPGDVHRCERNDRDWRYALEGGRAVPRRLPARLRAYSDMRSHWPVSFRNAVLSAGVLVARAGGTALLAWRMRGAPPETDAPTTAVPPKDV